MKNYEKLLIFLWSLPYGIVFYFAIRQLFVTTDQGAFILAFTIYVMIAKMHLTDAKLKILENKLKEKENGKS